MKRYLFACVLFFAAASLMAVPALREVKGEPAAGQNFACHHRGATQQLSLIRKAGKNRHSLERQMPPRVLVILTQFSNKDFREANDKAAWQQFFQGTGVSVRQYFIDQSFGQYSPEFDVVGPVTLDKTYEYYGKNIDGEDQAAEQMIADACRKADALGVDFTLYDADGDGYVDCVYVLYAGKGEADSKDENSVWPHNYRIEDAGLECILDGKHINTYVCSNELNAAQGREGIGTACHEFSHVLGLPDMYPTNGVEDYKTLGAWDLMDYGAYNNNTLTPPAYSAYERWFMGWTEPYLLAEPANFVLPDLNQSGFCGIITADGQSNLNGLMPDPTDFYLIENRQQTKGTWDEYLPGHGMLLTKISFVYSRWLYNEVNNLEKKMSIDIIEADGIAPHYATVLENGTLMEKDNGYRGKEGDTYPAKNATSVTLFNTYPLENITESSGVIRFDFMGGVSKCEVSFYSNSQYGTCTTSSLSETSKGAGITLPAATAKSGYTFLGWATTKRSTTPDAGVAGAKYYPMSDCTLYAIYRDDSNWRVDVGGASGVNGLLTGVTWEDGKTAANKYVTDKVAKGQDFYIFFLPRTGYSIPSPQTCQVRVTTGGKLIYVHSFVNGGVRLDFKAADLTGDIVIRIVNSREQKEGGCDDYAYTFASSLSAGAGIELGSYLWTVTMQNSEAPTDFTKNKGASFGSGTKPAQQVHLKTDDTMGCAVEKVIIHASVGSQGDAVLNVMVGGNIIGETEELTDTDGEYVFTPDEPATGALDIRFVNSQKTIFIRSINIVYTELKEDGPSTDLNEPAAGLPVSETDILGIYNLLGQPCGTSLENLPAGVYILHTAQGTFKVLNR